jgi:predicted nucleotidyltransferase
MNIEKIDKIERKILSILKRYNVKRAGIFGSVVRGEVI